MKNRQRYYINICQALQGEFQRYVFQAVSSRCPEYPMSNAKYKRLLKLAEYQNMALQGRRKYLPPSETPE